MSDSEDSIVTYTEVSSSFEDLSDIGSLGVDGLPMMPEDPYAYVVDTFQVPPSLDYVPSLEELEQAPLSPEFVPEPVYLEFMPPEDEEEEEEHLALADFVLPPVHRVTARMSIRDQPPTPFWYEAKIARLLTIPSPLPSPLSPLSSPLPQIPSPPLPVSSPVHVSPPPLPASPTYPLGYRAAMIWLRAETPSTSHPLPSSTPPSGTPPLLPISTFGITRLGWV
ncbi:hypothetical protein Tco_1026361 [Tanacetum coccineum]